MGQVFVESTLTGKQSSKLALQICDQALLLDTRERRSFVEKVCGGDEALVREVKDLLKAIDDSGKFLSLKKPWDDQT